MSNQPGNQIKTSIALVNIEPLAILGLADENLNIITDSFRAQITVRGNRIRIAGRELEVRQLEELFARLIKIARGGEVVTPEMVRREISQTKGKPTPKDRASGAEYLPRPDFGSRIGLRETGESVFTPKKSIQPKTPNQSGYLKAIDSYDLVICIGPAGTGKTYLAVAKAVAALSAGKIARIILTRPAVEAGESLGFLPGNLREKVDPYLRPLYDALYDMVPVEKLRRLYDEEVVEVAPLAYMRGRTLSDAFVILDEAQNTTPIQMKMFLTRLGWNSKAIVTGDITQIDLGRNQTSGLVEARRRLHKIEGVKFVYLDERDVVRPPLVSKIIKAYEAKD